MFIFIKKTAELVLKQFHDSKVVGRRKLPNPMLSKVFNILSISVRYTLSFEWPDFIPKDIDTVMPTVQRSKFKTSV